MFLFSLQMVLPYPYLSLSRSLFRYLFLSFSLPFLYPSFSLSIYYFKIDGPFSAIFIYLSFSLQIDPPLSLSLSLFFSLFLPTFSLSLFTLYLSISLYLCPPSFSTNTSFLWDLPNHTLTSTHTYFTSFSTNAYFIFD